MSRYALRPLPSYPWGPRGPHAAVVIGVNPPETREEAEAVRRAMPNGAHMEVVEIAAPCCGSHHWMGCADGGGSTCCPRCSSGPLGELWTA